jgi:hypothetical protein
MNAFYEHHKDMVQMSLEVVKDNCVKPLKSGNKPLPHYRCSAGKAVPSA